MLHERVELPAKKIGEDVEKQEGFAAGRVLCFPSVAAKNAARMGHRASAARSHP